MESFEQIFSQADRSGSEVPLGVIGADEATVLEAISEAQQRRWIRPILFGPKDKIESTGQEENIDLSAFEIHDTDDPAVAAVASVQRGESQFLMKGKVPTPVMMRAILDREHGLRTEATICQVVVLELPGKQRTIVLADTGICVEPSIEQRVEIMAAATRVARQIGADMPKVALMAATEKPTSAMPDSMESEEISRRFDEDEPASPRILEMADCYIQGPLSFDLAFDAMAGERKELPGPVVGRADVMIFPNLVSANLTVKAIMYTADCEFGGVLCGVRCPVVFMSRSDSKPTRLRSIALALRMLGEG